MSRLSLMMSHASLSDLQAMISGMDVVQYGAVDPRQKVAQWVEHAYHVDFVRKALLSLELSCWTGYDTGIVDESMASFDDDEWWIAWTLAYEGHNVFALPVRRLQGMKSPDASVSGLITEFKTYFGTSPTGLMSRVAAARAQADRIVIGIRSGDMARADVHDAFEVVVDSAERRGLQALKFIGVDYSLEWGSWNNASATIGGQSSFAMPPRCRGSGTANIRCATRRLAV